MSPESPEHHEIKKIIEDKLRDWYGASIDEFNDSGHELDVYAITHSGLRIYTEIIWHPSLSHLKSDLLILERSDANIKVVIANPEILIRDPFVREYNKTVISQKRKGVKIWGVMINGERILSESTYIDYEIKQIFDALIEESIDTDDQYNFEMELLNIINNELSSNEVRSRLSLVSTIEIFIGQRDEPVNWLIPGDENKWLVSNCPYALNTTARRNWYECQILDRGFLRIHSNGIFHLIIPMTYDTRKQRYYLHNIFFKIIDFLIYAIRIMKYKKLSLNYSIFIYLRNVTGIPINFSERHFGGLYHFSEEPSTKFNYDFYSNVDWSNYKEILFQLYRDLCNEMGAASISDETINTNVKSIIENMRSLRTTYKHENFILPSVPIDEFEF